MSFRSHFVPLERNTPRRVSENLHGDTPPLEFKRLTSKNTKNNNSVDSGSDKQLILAIVNKYFSKKKNKNGTYNTPRNVRKYPSFEFQKPEVDQEHEREFGYSAVGDLEYLMRQTFFCHDGNNSNFRRKQLIKLIDNADSASELLMKLNYLSYNDHNFTMQIEKPHNIPVKDMEKVLKDLAFDNMERLHIENAALQTQLEVIYEQSPATGANTSLEKEKLFKILERHKKVMDGLFEVAYNLISYTILANLRIIDHKIYFPGAKSNEAIGPMASGLNIPKTITRKLNLERLWSHMETSFGMEGFLSNDLPFYLIKDPLDYSKIARIEIQCGDAQYKRILFTDCFTSPGDVILDWEEFKHPSSGKAQVNILLIPGKHSFLHQN